MKMFSVLLRCGTVLILAFTLVMVELRNMKLEREVKAQQQMIEELSKRVDKEQP